MMKNKQVIALVAMIMVVVVVAEGAITCGGVARSIAPCMQYLKTTGATPPPPPCCNGVRTLKDMAQSPWDRKAACQCLKAAATQTKGVNFGTANRLPGQCGVNIGYTISPNINCDTVT